jgi:hypothetical protein
MKIIHPRQGVPFKNTGQVLLRFDGDNLANLNMRTCKEATLEYNKSDPKLNHIYGKTIPFNLTFKEYFGETLILDFHEGGCFQKTSYGKTQIGKIKNFDISLTNSHLFISGTYFHKSITLAYHESNHSLFEFFAEINAPELRTLKALIDYYEYLPKFVENWTYTH